MMFDQFFDSLNVSNFEKEWKPFKDPYRSASDFRLKVKHRLADYVSVHNMLNYCSG